MNPDLSSPNPDQMLGLQKKAESAIQITAIFLS